MGNPRDFGVITPQNRAIDELAVHAASYLREHGAEEHVALVVGPDLMEDDAAKITLAAYIHRLTDRGGALRFAHDDHELAKLLVNSRRMVVVMHSGISMWLQQRITRLPKIPRLTLFVPEHPNRLARKSHWLRNLARQCTSVVFDLRDTDRREPLPRLIYADSSFGPQEMKRVASARRGTVIGA